MKESKIWLILPVIVILMAAGLGYVMHMEKVSAEAESARLEALAEKARPYIEEQEEIRNELAKSSGNYSTTRNVGIALVGYDMVSTDDLEMIQRHASTYNIRPILVLDVTAYNPNYSYNMDRMVEAINETDYEVVLTTTKFDPDILTKIEPLREQLNNDANCFLLRNTDDSEYNLTMIAQAGYQSCVRYVNNNNTAIRKDGLVCLSYSYITSSNVDISSRLEKLDKSNLTTMFVFSMEDLDEDVIIYNLDMIEDYMFDGGMEYRSLKGAVDQAYEDSRSQEDRQAEYRAYVDERMERMAELQRIVREIYGEA